MLSSFSNYVKAAVDRVGGPTKAAHLLKVSNTTIHNWVTNQRVPEIEQARKLAQLSDLPVDQLRRIK